MAKHSAEIARSALTGRWTAADAERFEKQAADFTKKHASSPEAAREYLQKLGTHTPTGRLTKRYGG